MDEAIPFSCLVIIRSVTTTVQAQILTWAPSISPSPQPIRFFWSLSVLFQILVFVSVFYFFIKSRGWNTLKPAIQYIHRILDFFISILSICTKSNVYLFLFFPAHVFFTVLCQDVSALDVWMNWWERAWIYVFSIPSQGTGYYKSFTDKSF